MNLARTTRPRLARAAAAAGRRAMLAAVLALLVGLPPAAAGPTVAAAAGPPAGPGWQEQPGGGSDRAGEMPRRRVRGDRVVIGDSIVIPENVIQDGQVVCIFGKARIDGLVTDAVVAIGCKLEMSGAVRHDLVGVLSDMKLESTARVGGEFFNIAGELDDRGAEMRRGRTNIPLRLPLSGVDRPLSILGAALLWSRSLSAVLFFVALLVLAALVPERIRNLSDETPVRYFMAFFVGLAGYIGATIAVLLLLSTVIGIPVIPFFCVMFVVLKWLGRAGILLFVGRKLGALVGTEPSPLGAVLLGVVLYSLLLLGPLLVGGIGGIVAHFALSCLLWLLIDVPAIGLILLTRAGRPRGPGASVDNAPAAPDAGSRALQTRGPEPSPTPGGPPGG